jgi:two-component system, LytTR family, response regulator
MIRAVLVDDEPQSCRSLVIKLKAVADDIDVVGTFHHPEKAINGISDLDPDVVFLDIEMPVMNGFQLLEKIESFTFEVIFITAYNNFVLNALHVSALDYLLKPVDTTELGAAIARLRKKLSFNENRGIHDERTLRPLARLKEGYPPTRLVLATAQGMLIIKIIDIIRVEALGNYSTFYLVNREKIVISKTLKEYEEILLKHKFFRISRSCIVNTEFIIEYKHEDGGVAELQDGSRISVGPHRKQDLITLLRSL